MNLCVTLHDGPLGPAGTWQVDGAGALIVFEGIVRPDEAGQSIAGLAYETYDPMAEQQLRQLGEQILRDFSLLAMTIEHSRGLVPVSGCSFRLQIASAHRREAIEAMEQFIDTMKRDVAIWKKPIIAEAPARKGSV